MPVAVSSSRPSQPASAGLSRERVELILNQLDRLPTLPAVVARLLAVTSSDKSSAPDVIAIIESDASLTAGILRMVSRAHLGVRSEAMTAARAVTLLGFRAVRNAALSTQFFSALTSRDEDSSTATTRKGLWEHSLAVACAAELIADRIGGVDGGEAFVCGLLHDIGKIALDVCLPKSYARVVEYVARQRACICDVERELFGMDHTVAGKRLVVRWQLPQPVLESVWLHHQSPDDLPSSVSSLRLLRIVHLADNLIRRQRIGFSGYLYLADVDALAGDLGLDAAAVGAVVEAVPQRMAPFRELFGLDGTAGSPLPDESLAAVNRQLSEINAQLTEANRSLTFRSTCFDALGRFARTVTEHDRVGDVCAAAAEVTAGLLRAPLAIAYVGQAESRCIHVGSYDASAGIRSALVLELGPEGDGGTTAIPDVDGIRGLAPAPDGCDAIWHRVAASPAAAPLWILPLCAQDLSGGVLVALDQEAVRGGRAAVAESATLSDAFNLAVSSAWARVAAETMTEELLDLNRRCRAAEAELVRMRSIAMVAEMAAGAAHELNNPLAVISGRAQMELGLALEPERRRAMEIIISQTERASQIVLDLMSFAKPEPPCPRVQPLAAVLEQLCQHWRESSGFPGDRLTVSQGDPDATVFADPEQLREILVAVVANAIGACDTETGRVQVNSPSCASDETVRVVVEDNGPGMTAEVLEHAFDPFFSNRSAGRGRGMGLSRAYRLVEVNGGRLWIDSTLNAGTTVTIELPARAPSA